MDGEDVVNRGALALVAPDETASPHLARLTRSTRARSPVQVLSAGPGRVGAFDVDAQQANDPDGLTTALRHQASARGAALASPEIARAAARAGVRVLETPLSCGADTRVLAVFAAAGDLVQFDAPLLNAA